MARMSNRDRIARAAEEARLAAEEKAKKKAAKEAAPKAPKAAAKPRSKEVRMKVVWTVCNASGKALKTFGYADKEAAEREVQRLSSASGQHHELRALKVPMD